MSGYKELFGIARPGAGQREPKEMATCRDCKLWDRERAKDKAGRIRKDRAARCLWVSTETWPMSVPESLNRRPTAGYMTADDGNRCKRFIPVTPNAKVSRDDK